MPFFSSVFQSEVQNAGLLETGIAGLRACLTAGLRGSRFWLIQMLRSLVGSPLSLASLSRDLSIASATLAKYLDKACQKFCVFPANTLQTYIVHLIRNRLDYASWKDRKALAAAIKPIYTASSAEAALAELDVFEAGPWGAKFPTVAAAWRRNWDKVIPFFAFPAHIRRVIYTTNAIESVNARLRKIIKTRGHFPSDDAASKLIWLALRNITTDWGRASRDWKEAMNQFAILYEDRFEGVPDFV